jgi:hypothetical protein
MKAGFSAACLSSLSKKTTKLLLQLLFENVISIFSENLNTTIMKTFKLIDFWVSVGLVVSFLIIIAAGKPDSLIDENILVAYGVIGGWHIISMLVHSIAKWFTPKWGTRFWYHIISCTLVVTIPAGSVWILVFIAPFMAFFYTAYCGYEVYIKMNRRPLTVLK